jgi:hypothetical protein
VDRRIIIIQISSFNLQICGRNNNMQLRVLPFPIVHISIGLSLCDGRERNQLGQFLLKAGVPHCAVVKHDGGVKVAVAVILTINIDTYFFASLSSVDGGPDWSHTSGKLVVVVATSFSFRTALMVVTFRLCLKCKASFFLSPPFIGFAQTNGVTLTLSLSIPEYVVSGKHCFVL